MARIKLGNSPMMRISTIALIASSSTKYSVIQWAMVITANTMTTATRSLISWVKIKNLNNQMNRGSGYIILIIIKTRMRSSQIIQRTICPISKGLLSIKSKGNRRIFRISTKWISLGLMNLAAINLLGVAMRMCFIRNWRTWRRLRMPRWPRRRQMVVMMVDKGDGTWLRLVRWRKRTDNNAAMLKEVEHHHRNQQSHRNLKTQTFRGIRGLARIQRYLHRRI